MSITSSILNPITFKHRDGLLPCQWNTLHENFKLSAYKTIKYCQPFQKDGTVKLQFISPDSDIEPTLLAFADDGTRVTIPVSSTNTVVGDITRYYFNFEFTLGSDYYDKKVYFVINQGSDYWDGEPIYTEDLTDKINNGQIRKIEYSNNDAVISDLNGYYIDFSTITNNSLDFYFECVDRELNPTTEREILEATENDVLISSTSKSGVIVSTGIIPSYVYWKLQTACGLDEVLINDREYIVNNIEQETVGGSTSVQATITTTDKFVLGINTDDLGVSSETERDIMNKEYLSQTSSFNVERQKGYSLHQILITHSGTSSSNDATVICGNSLGSGEYIDSISGLIANDNKIHSFIPHHTPDPTSAGQVYFGISGSGVSLNIYIQFIKITE